MQNDYTNHTLSPFVLGCLMQLVEGITHRMHFISDGSASKVVEGVLVQHVECSTRGVYIYCLDQQGKTRRVSWRMRQSEAVALRDAFTRCELCVQNTATHTTSEVRIHAVHPVISCINTYDAKNRFCGTIMMF